MTRSHSCRSSSCSLSSSLSSSVSASSSCPLSKVKCSVGSSGAMSVPKVRRMAAMTASEAFKLVGTESSDGQGILLG